MISWSIWARLVAEPVIDGVKRVGFPIDLSWTGPWWLDARSLPHVIPWLALPAALVLLVLVYWSAIRLWEPMGRAEERFRRKKLEELTEEPVDVAE
jgi:hypothetical protein